MNKDQLLDLTKRVSTLTGINLPIIVGSQTLYAVTNNVPDRVKRSIECDYLLISVEAIKAVTRELGVFSQYQVAVGYYADPLGLATVVLPPGWESRLISLTDSNGNVCAKCLDTCDAAISKLMAGREKDFAFIIEIIDRNFITINDFVERASLIRNTASDGALLPRLTALLNILKSHSYKYNLTTLNELIGQLK